MSITDPIFQRYRDAYLQMAPFYRPGAPSDGFGNIQLTAEQCRDQQRLRQEASAYTSKFLAEDQERVFDIGCADYRTARAFMWAIEAARQLASGSDSNTAAVRLLKMAIEDIGTA
jgi:hypothetical protein